MCTQAAPVRVTRYGAGLRQSAHTHDAPHISLVLAGAFAEEAGRAEIAFGAGRFAFRPEGMRHAGTFSPSGALILTFDFTDRAPGMGAPYWSRPLSRTHLRALTPLLLGEADEARDAAWDLFALSDAEADGATPTAWLRDVHDQLAAEPARSDIGALAAKAGRHRVHLTRAFVAAFGETPSAFRRRAMLNRALCEMTRGASAAIAAVGAGFSDQSHFIRACRETYGVTPVQLTRRAADVASVQYGAA